MLTFTCLSTSNIYVWLMVFFLFLNACGKGGGFTVSPFGASSSCSGSTTLGSSTSGLGADGLTSLPLLKVTTAFTSSIMGFGPLVELNSCTPLGFGCVWHGKFPFSRTYYWLVNLETEYCRSSIFFVECAFQCFDFLSGLSIHCLMFFHKVTHNLAQFTMACFIRDEGGGCCCCEVEPRCCCCCEPMGA